jgi:hypothetical protein
MLRAFLPVLILSICGVVHATSSTVFEKPSLQEYLDRHLSGCTQFSRLSFEQCEAIVTKNYKRAPFFTANQFVAQLAKNKALTRTLTIVTEEQLFKLTQELLTLPINYHEEINGCSERAEAIAYYLMSRHKINVGQVYLKGSIQITSIHLPLENAGIRWSHHIAPFIMVKNAVGKIYPYSLDLTLLQKQPRPVEQWIEIVQKDSPYLLEVHTLRGFETGPVEPGETAIKSWQERPMDVLEAALKESRPVMIHRKSPLRTDLAVEFIQLMSANLVKLGNPYDQLVLTEEPLPLTEVMSPPAVTALKMKIKNELRCEDHSLGVLHCGIYFFDEKGEGFCQAHTEIPRTSKEPLQIPCYPFNL